MEEELLNFDNRCSERNRNFQIEETEENTETFNELERNLKTSTRKYRRKSEVKLEIKQRLFSRSEKQEQLVTR